MHVVVQIGSVVLGTDTEEYYWSQTLEAWKNKCLQLTANDNFESSCHQEEIKVQVIDILESFIGNFLDMYIYVYMYILMYLFLK